MTTRTCTTCQGEFPETTEFFYKHDTSKGGISTQCRECHKAHGKRYYHGLSPEKKYNRGRHYNFTHKYGISFDDYERMLVEQGGGCAICGRTAEENANKKLHVDHCHGTGRVRGLLCLGCNTGLGGFRDDPDLLARASNYLFILEARK